MTMKTIALLVLLLLAGETPIYCFEADPMPASADSGRVATPRNDTPPEDTTVGAAVSATMKKLADQRARKKQVARLSCWDTLVTYYLPQRINQRETIDRSFYLNAGGYFRFDPSYVVTEHQMTPMRTTVQPFGLAGDRLGVLSGDASLHPFEHIPEPDGLIDLSDIPTALDESVVLLPGAVGGLFGSHRGVATLLTRPARPSPTEAHSAFLVDKSGLIFSHPRARFSQEFTDGRTVDMSVDYRTSSGLYYGYDDDTYNYDADFFFPIGSRSGMRTTGHLYSRDGILAIVRPASGSFTKRTRFDRLGRVQFVSYGADNRSRNTFGYTHTRQGSYLSQTYDAHFNNTEHALSASREWLGDSATTMLSVSADRQLYGDGRESHYRYSSEADIRWASLSAGTRTGYRVGIRSAERFVIMPSASVVVTSESERFWWLGSVGYDEREPSLHERYLPYRAASIYYGSSTPDYADSGNVSLNRERQIVGSLQMEIGAARNAFGLSCVGGRIWDAIDWRNQGDSIRGLITFFPVNDDITFATTAVYKDVRLADFLRFHGGASYHYIKYTSGEKKSYQPDYSAVAGMELHVYWRQKLVHLYAYGEAVYVGPYRGYAQSRLGNMIEINAKLSFSMGRFRFYYLIQNAISGKYNTRDYLETSGRLASWGFVWNFLN